MELSRTVALLTGHILLVLIIFCTQLTSFTWSILLVGVSVLCGSPSTLCPVPDIIYVRNSPRPSPLSSSSIFTNKPRTLRCGVRTKLAVKCFLWHRGSSGVKLTVTQGYNMPTQHTYKASITSWQFYQNVQRCTLTEDSHTPCVVWDVLL